jgi:hypothetical protein
MKDKVASIIRVVDDELLLHCKDKQTMEFLIFIVSDFQSVKR